MSRRFWLITISVAAHLAVGIGMFATGVWRLERLESDYRFAGVAMIAPPAPSGSPAELPRQQLRPKQQRKVVKEPVQPAKPPPDQEVARAEVSTAETGNGKGQGPGDGEHEDGDPADTGTCLTPPCGEATAAIPIPTPPVRPPVARDVAPTVLQHLRISGNTQLHPTDVIKTRMLREGRSRSVGMVKVCISTTGTISSVAILQSTKYPEFDATLLAGVRGWRYRPHRIDGIAVPVCGMVSFVYSIK